jgi:maltose O-acetyltransferase
MIEPRHKLPLPLPRTGRYETASPPSRGCGRLKVSRGRARAAELGLPAVLRALLKSWPVRQITRATVFLLQSIGRLASYARARMLFPDSDVIIHWSTEIKYPENITFGKRVIVGPRCTIGAIAPIVFGDDVHISKGVFVETGTLDIDTTLPPYRRSAKPIRVGNGVWLGASSVVLAGITIGDNAVVSAGVVVRKNVPANTVIADARPILQSLELLEREPVTGT